MTEAEQNRLIISNMALVGVIAADYLGRGVDLEDLAAIGQEGLVLAARAYHENSGYPFPTWASQRINRHIKNELKSRRHHLLNDAQEEDETHVERVFEHSMYGWLVYELWPDKFDGSAEPLHLMMDHIQEKHQYFQQAFLLLTERQQKLITLVYLRDPPMSIDRAARELKISYLKAWRMLETSLKIMRESVAAQKASRGRRVIDLTQ